LEEVGTWSRERSFQISENRWSSKSQSPSTRPATATVGIRKGAAGRRRSKQKAASSANGPAGFAWNAARRWPCTVASTLVVIPQSGHGTPVSVRSGQGIPAWPGRNGTVAAAASIARARPRASDVSIVVEEAGSRNVARCYSLRRLETTPFGGEQALEEHLVALALDRAADLRTQAARKLRRDLDAGSCGELVPARQEGGDG